MADPDPYEKLRETAPTPPEELCACEPLPPLLVYCSGANPLHCLACNREVAPERVGLSAAVAQSLAFWASFYKAFDTLWLDSGDFEDWARGHLSDPGSAVNRRGLDVVAQVAQRVPCYLAWFEEPGADDFVPLSFCPRCAGPLQRLHRGRVCSSCRIAVLN